MPIDGAHALFVASTTITLAIMTTYVVVLYESFSCPKSSSWHIMRQLISTTYRLMLMYPNAYNNLVDAPLKWVLRVNEKIDTKFK